MRELVRTNVPGFLKDRKSGLIVSDDVGALARVMAMREQSKNLVTLQRDMDKIKQQIAAINKALGLE